MPEILPDHVPSPRTPLVWDGTRYRAVRGHTDGTVQVRGEDQLISYLAPLFSIRTAAVSGANGYLDSFGPPAGFAWKITNIRAVNDTSPTTRHIYYGRHAGVDYTFEDIIAAMAAGVGSYYHGEIWLDPTDVVRIYFMGSLVGDTCFIDLTGHVLTKE